MIAVTNSTRRLAIPSRINAHGIRVYIPEKGKKAGRRWFKPYVFNNLNVAQAYPLLYSFHDQVTIPFSFSGAYIVITAPFSLALLNSYTARAAAMNRSNVQVRKVVGLLKDLDPNDKEKYDHKRTGDTEHDAQLIFTLRHGTISAKP